MQLPMPFTTRSVHRPIGSVANFKDLRHAPFNLAILEGAVAEVRTPRVLVEAPATIVRQQLENLPAGVVLAPGRIVVEGFMTLEEAQQQILALIMAMGNDPEGFAELVTEKC